MDENEKYALVTGGSSGFGMEFSKLLGKDGYSLIIVAKPQEELDRGKKWFTENMPDVHIVYRQQDLAIQGAAQELYDFTHEKGYNIEIFINNAGFATFGYFKDLDINRELDMINLNVVAVYQLTQLYLRDMYKKDSGKILITASSAAFLSMPRFTTYSATKAFSFLFGYSLGQELKELGSNVTLTVLCPPSARTGFQHAAGMDHMKVFDKSNKMTKDPDFIAKEGYKALKQGKEFIIPGTGFRLFLNLLDPMTRRRRMNWVTKLLKGAMK